MLLIDAGNTRIKWAVPSDHPQREGRWRQQDRKSVV